MIPKGYNDITRKQTKLLRKEVRIGSKDKNQIIRIRTVGFSGFTNYTFKKFKSFILRMCLYSTINHRAKRWKQPKCPSIDEWVNKMLYVKQQNIIQS